MRKLKKEIKQTLLFAGLLGMGVLSVRVPAFVSAYYADQFTDHNLFQVKEVTGDIVEEFDPPTLPPELPESPYVYEYEKDIKVENTGDADSYVRVAMELSDPDVAGVTEYSGDGGKTWYAVSEYRNHLPENWIYQEDSSSGKGGFFYYTKKLKAHALAETSLLTKVRTTYSKQTDIIPYEIIVKAEWIDAQDEHGNRIEEQDAWKAYWQARTGKRGS